MADLRRWLEKVDEIGELKTVKGADWNLEIGCISDLEYKLKKNRARFYLMRLKVTPRGSGY